jgi:hypothetical protein
MPVGSGGSYSVSWAGGCKFRRCVNFGGGRRGVYKFERRCKFSGGTYYHKSQAFHQTKRWDSFEEW